MEKDENRDVRDQLSVIFPDIAAKDAEIAKLREELAATYEELIDHNGDSLDDTRAKRVAALKEKADV
ncbi:hypothetical protein D3C80_1683550 [compost metagenome]